MQISLHDPSIGFQFCSLHRSSCAWRWWWCEMHVNCVITIQGLQCRCISSCLCRVCSLSERESTSLIRRRRCWSWLRASEKSVSACELQIPLLAIFAPVLLPRATCAWISKTIRFSFFSRSTLLIGRSAKLIPLNFSSPLSGFTLLFVWEFLQSFAIVRRLRMCLKLARGAVTRVGWINEQKNK